MPAPDPNLHELPPQWPQTANATTATAKNRQTNIMTIARRFILTNASCTHNYNDNDHHPKAYLNTKY